MSYSQQLTMPGIQEDVHAVDSRPAAKWRPLAGMDKSLAEHQALWTFLLLGCGCLARIWHASGTFLNSDEVMHFAAANRVTWLETYKASLAISHPPLLIFIEHVWRHLGTSELILRMPSIIAGTAFCFFTFLWAQMVFEKNVAWITYAFVLFLPSSIELSSEVRQYALLLAFAMASAYLLERALAKECPSAMWLSGACLWLAICSHYSAFLFAAALGIYAIWRMLTQHPTARVVAAWIATQVIALGLCVFFYVTQIRRLSGYFHGQDPTQGWMENAYLGHSYFVPGRVNPLVFIIGRTVGMFQYTFRQLAVGDVTFVLFLVGVIMVFRNRQASARATSAQLGWLLLLPFVANCAAAMVRVYPYGGTRHSCFLLPFGVAGVSLALDRVLKHKLAPALGTALAVSLLCNFAAAKELPYVAPGAEQASYMRAAMDFAHRIPADEPIFADAQTSLMLGHYLCEQRPYVADHSLPDFVSYECGGHRVIASTTQYVFSARSFDDQWYKMLSGFHVQPGTRIWVAQMGWRTNLAMELAKFSELHLQAHYFGPEIQLFDLTAGQPMPDRRLLPTT